jgi:hypothetical protein
MTYFKHTTIKSYHEEATLPEVFNFSSVTVPKGTPYWKYGYFRFSNYITKLEDPRGVYGRKTTRKLLSYFGKIHHMSTVEDGENVLIPTWSFSTDSSGSHIRTVDARDIKLEIPFEEIRAYVSKPLETIGYTVEKNNVLFFDCFWHLLNTDLLDEATRGYLTSYLTRMDPKFKSVIFHTNYHNLDFNLVKHVYVCLENSPSYGSEFDYEEGCIESFFKSDLPKGCTIHMEMTKPYEYEPNDFENDDIYREYMFRCEEHENRVNNLVERLREFTGDYDTPYDYKNMWCFELTVK